MFLFYITMETVVRDEGVLYTYFDVSYILAPTEQMAFSPRSGYG
jgi:hypothetical protein